jgi:hypothetical protein
MVSAGKPGGTVIRHPGQPVWACVTVQIRRKGKIRRSMGLIHIGKKGKVKNNVAREGGRLDNKMPGNGNCFS